ncbi:hypothetical protein DRP77_06210 [Candidatus Poribacteria bacterium]|nr:MAG: hypothetical protein DRP77_06210 [Candidatus Poribacteria bacterium]
MKPNLSIPDKIHLSKFDEVLILFEPNQVVELRIPKPLKDNRVFSGYFNDFEALTAAARKWDGKAEAIYVTLNPVNPALLARSANRLRTVRKGEATTSDADILCRRWLPIDLDPVRPAGVSSTDEEHEAAIQRAKEIREWLKGLGWPEPIFADSGNGAHLLYRIDLQNDETSRELIRKCLQILDLKFSDDKVKVDITTYNAARIWKLYGTLVCKGDNLPERPHRRSRILEIPQKVEVIPIEKLRELADMLPHEEPLPAQIQAGEFDIAKWIEEHGLEIRKVKPWNGATVYELATCPFNPDHNRGEAFIIQFPSGAIYFRCFHNSCADKDWHSLRDLLEPGWREKAKQDKVKRKRESPVALDIDDEALPLEKRVAIALIAAKPENQSDGRLSPEGEAMIAEIREAEQLSPVVFKFRAHMARRALVDGRVHTLETLMRYLPLKELMDRGKFLKDDKNNPTRLWFFDEESRRVYNLESGMFRYFVTAITECPPETALFKRMMADIETKAALEGEVRKVHKWTHFDKEKRVLYIHNGDDKVYRLDGEEIVVISNGEEVLFESFETFSPFEIEPQGMSLEEARKLWLSTVCDLEPDTSGLSEGEASRVTQNCIRLQFIWTLCLPFDSLMRTRPIHCAIGPKGAGKTTLTRKVGLILFGERFNVTTVGENVRDIEAILTNEPFAVFDNLESSPKWFMDLLAIAATGGTVKRRKLYTTNEEAQYPITAWVCVNAIEPRFRRDDVADRLLIFKLSRRRQFIPEDELVSRIVARRRELLTAYIVLLNRVVRELKEREGLPSRSYSFRMADFARLGEVIAAALYGEDEARKFIESLEEMQEVQTEFTLADDPVWEALSKWLKNPANLGREITSSELYNELDAIINPPDSPRRRHWISSPRAMGRHLARLKTNIERLGYRITHRHTRDGKIWSFLKDGDNEL